MGETEQQTRTVDVDSRACWWGGLEALEPRHLLSTVGDEPAPAIIAPTGAGMVRQINTKLRNKAKGRNANTKLVIQDAAVTEGDPGQVRQMVFRVVRKGNLSGTTQVRFAATKRFVPGVRNATENIDFNAKSGRLTFQPGVKVRTIPVGVIGDNVAEADEQFLVTLSQPRGGVIQRGVAIGTIIDNDAGKTVDVAITNDNFNPDDNLLYPPTLLPVRLTYSNSGNADSGVTAVQFKLILFNNGQVDGTVDLGPFILVPNVPAGGSIQVDYLLDFNRAFTFNDRWDVFAQLLIEDDNMFNNIRRLGDIQITLPAA
jgi:hypothetical protein